MRRTSLEHDTCPIARTLDTIGEWWSLLIVRNAMLGMSRFSDFQRSLGMARNILSTRLKHLVERGILEMVPASDGSAYQEYVLTEKGQALWTLLTAMRQWGTEYLYQPGEERTEVLDKEQHKPLARLAVQNAKGKQVSTGHTDLVYGKVTRDGGFKAARI